MEDFPTLWSLVAFTCAATGLYKFYFTKPAYPLPPGPTVSWFGLGKDGAKLPGLYPWLTYAKWQEKYGDLIFINIFKNRILVLNSVEAAQDLLEKRSAIYSSRPVRTMQSELMGFSFLFSSMEYNPWYKKHRNMFHAHFQPKILSKYHPLQIKHTNTLLRNLLRSPDTLEHHIRRTTAAIVLEVCYGHHVAEQGDEYVVLADNAISGIIQCGNFGTYMVDYLPMLKYVPAWMPGAKFKRQARVWKNFSQQMLNFPFEMVKRKLENGTAEPCLMTVELEDWFRGERSNDADQETVIKGVGATAYAAGSDTTMSALLCFFLAMTLYPEIQERARADIDRVVPKDRLPQFSDRENLPFINCLVWECLRWNPAVNIAIAHYSTENDIYRGFYIPKGTTILANIWSMLHDPIRYPEPMKFNPDRFMDATKNATENINSVPEISFGFGRRKASFLLLQLICPGRVFATDTIWIVIASILSVYKISKAVDESGHEINPRIEFTSGLVSRPKPFKYQIKSRSAEAEVLIEQTAGES